ncbi:MAG: shikimate kinase [Bacteroidota bacterium]
MTAPPRVYLTGFMASGKSTVGPLLADALGHRFVDLDWLIEAKAGRPIPLIFAEGGETAFRAAEAEALDETTRSLRMVVATGGGALVTPAALRTARMAGPVVWLQASIDTILDRLGDAAGRPVLAGPDGRPLWGRALRDRVAALMEAREPFYAQADLTVDADAVAAIVAQRIVEGLRGWSRPT